MISSSQQKIFTEDLLVRDALLKRDSKVTLDYFYKQCYPLFKSIYDNYYTDSTCVMEFINEIYLLVMTPSKETGHCQLENYKGESSLATWLKTVCLFHCYHHYQHKERMPIVEIVVPESRDDDDYADRFLDNSYSTTMDLASIERADLDVIIDSMSNERYRSIIRLRYVEQRTNEETAEALNMSMTNYYNKHKLAKEQFVKALRKEFGNV